MEVGVPSQGGIDGRNERASQSAGRGAYLLGSAWKPLPITLVRRCVCVCILVFWGVVLGEHLEMTKCVAASRDSIRFLSDSHPKIVTPDL